MSFFNLETLMLTFSRENFNEMPRNQSEINKAGYRLQLRKKPWNNKTVQAYSFNLFWLDDELKPTMHMIGTNSTLLWCWSMTKSFLTTKKMCLLCNQITYKIRLEMNYMSILVIFFLEFWKIKFDTKKGGYNFCSLWMS